MIIIVNCQACGKQLFRDQDYEPKGHGVQLLVPPCDCAAQPRVQLTGGTCAACGEGNVVFDGCCINCGTPATSG